MNFDFGREPMYANPDGSIAFFNGNKNADGYDVVINNHRFYLPTQTLYELTASHMSTLDMMCSLETIWGQKIHGTLFENNLCARDMHIALLHVRNMHAESKRPKDYAAREDTLPSLNRAGV